MTMSGLAGGPVVLIADPYLSVECDCSRKLLWSCLQALQLWWAKRVARQRAGERQSRERQRKRKTLSYLPQRTRVSSGVWLLRDFSRLTPNREQARRLNYAEKRKWAGGGKRWGIFLPTSLRSLRLRSLLPCPHPNNNFNSNILVRFFRNYLQTIYNL